MSAATLAQFCREVRTRGAERMSGGGPSLLSHLLNAGHRWVRLYGGKCRGDFRSGCIGSAVYPDVLTSIAVRAGDAPEVDELPHEASSGLAGASRSKIGLQHDPSITFDVVG